MKSMIGSNSHHIVSIAKFVQGPFSVEGMPNRAPETAGILIIRITCLEIVDSSVN